MTGALIALLVIALAAAWVVASWRGLTSARNAVDAGWAAIDAQLRRRHTLAETVTGDARVEDARRQAEVAGTPFARAEAERKLAAALADHSDAGGFQAELAAIEDDVQAARRRYNADVRLYLTRRAHFPGALLRRLGDFAERPYFELDHTRDRGPRALAAV